MLGDSDFRVRFTLRRVFLSSRSSRFDYNSPKRYRFLNFSSFVSNLLAAQSIDSYHSFWGTFVSAVTSYGTEGRGTNGFEIMPSNKVFEYMVFDRTQIKVTLMLKYSIFLVYFFILFFWSKNFLVYLSPCFCRLYTLRAFF